MATDNSDNSTGHRFTKTEQRIVDVLSDGAAHLRAELMELLPDPEMGVVKNLNNHLGSIRKKIRPSGQDVLCVIVNRRLAYRQVRTLASAVDGKR